MRRLLLLFATVLLFALATTVYCTAQHRSANSTTANELIGAWRLAWLEEPGADGKVHRADCTGLLIFTGDGHMSVQVMYRTPPAVQSGPVQYTTGGYEASFGTYQINDAHTFTFHVEGALVRKLVGEDLKRVYELSGKQLIVKSPDPNEHWRVAWERD